MHVRNLASSLGTNKTGAPQAELDEFNSFRSLTLFDQRRTVRALGFKQRDSEASLSQASQMPAGQHINAGLSSDTENRRRTRSTADGKRAARSPWSNLYLIADHQQQLFVETAKPQCTTAYRTRFRSPTTRLDRCQHAHDFPLVPCHRWLIGLVFFTDCVVIGV